MINLPNLGNESYFLGQHHDAGLRYSATDTHVASAPLGRRWHPDEERHSVAMLFTFNAGHQQHAPAEILIRGNPIPNFEQPERLERLKAQLLAENHELQESRAYSRKWV